MENPAHYICKRKLSVEFDIEAIDMIDGTWRDCISYDIVYHVAGIAHADVGNVDDDKKRSIMQSIQILR